jgi:formylglycine-generating enzyme required for sulfatase activity
MRFAILALAVAHCVLAVGEEAFAGSPQPLSSFKDCDACPEMVALPPGKFLMGASKEDSRLVLKELPGLTAEEAQFPEERPQHEVAIGYSFAIGKFEVTVAEFAAYVAETGARTGGECLILTPYDGPLARKVIGTVKPTPEMKYGSITVTDADFRTPGAKTTDRHPATCISRREAAGYLEWLGKKTGKPYRFPTEAEWEYGVRAGSTTPFYYGGGFADLCRYGNHADLKSPYSARYGAKCAENPSPVGTAIAGSYKPNAWGLHDMIGNAFEFVEDCSFENYNGAPADGSPWRKDGCVQFVQRSYDFGNVPGNLRSAARCLPGDWESRANNLTIRVALSLDDAAWDRKN